MQHMKMAMVLMVASATWVAAQDPPGRVGRLNYSDGAVSIQPTGMNEWVDADINRPLTTGDNIWVGDRGRAEFHIGSAVLRLGANSDFQFLNLDDQTVQIRLSAGTLAVHVRNLNQNQIFEVDTPNLAFTPERAGDYRIDVNPDSQTTTVTVHDGEGEVLGGDQSFPVYARQRVEVSGGDQINYNLAAAGGPDEFDQWGSSRDRGEDQSQSARYVSREMPGYEDLDRYGSWGDQPGYGQVWMPSAVGVGWAPYHDGHWAWIAPWGWTWVDDAPWGFAPYHYGRWASFGNRWGWIPGPYGVTPTYAPALVAWVGGGGGGFNMSFSIGTAAAIGWFPLGPREPYFPSYQSSQDYFTRVNNTNTVISNTTINNYYNGRNASNPSISYANRTIQNAVTAVPRNTFASGRRINQYSLPVPTSQMAAVQVVAGPAITPQRESVLGPRAESAARAARPPANVFSRPVVARTAPPPAAVPFDRQQSALARNPGRALPPAEVGQLRQSAPASTAPVRVMDMGRARRVQPGAGAEPTRGQQPNGPPGTDRINVPPGRQPQQQRDVQQQDNQRQQQATQREDAQRQQQQTQQQDAQRQDAQRRQQQDAQRQQQQTQQQDVQRQQQQAQQQDAQRQDAQRRQQQDSQRQQQQAQQQDAQRQQQQAQQQDAQRQPQQQRQQQEAQRPQQQPRQQPAPQADKPQSPPAEPSQRPDQSKRLRPPANEEEKKKSQ
ncbi:MAG TPA: DUF6600 domain-containing protein [Bryobacteraceae bacterium]|nr:DUF6600 domain-containing protein [Bryobacteraceae bacterium]